LPKDTEFIPVSYGKSLSDQLNLAFRNSDIDKQKTLYILDWCPEMDDLDECCEVFEKVILIDHHESAIRKLCNHYTITEFDDSIPKNLELFLAHNNEWSGAMGTAIWFHNHAEDYKECDGDGLIAHWLVKAVDDRDRWQFKLPNTKEINEGLFDLGFNLKDWQDCTMDEISMLSFASTGSILLRKKQQDAQALIDANAFYMEGDDNPYNRIAFCNCPHFLASDVGNILAKTCRVAVLFSVNKEQELTVSLRSNSATQGWINCATLAQRMNPKGGGHANAAGFVYLSAYEWVLNILTLVGDIIEEIYTLDEPADLRI